MCIAIVEIWFGLAPGWIFSIVNWVICPPHDTGWVVSFHVIIVSVEHNSSALDPINSDIKRIWCTCLWWILYSPQFLWYSRLNFFSVFLYKGEKGLKKKEEDKEEGPRTERTVDEIIASLRSQSKSGQWVYTCSSIIVFSQNSVWAAPCKTCLWADADSEGPDQTAQMSSLIRAFAVHKQNHWIL